MPTGKSDNSLKDFMLRNSAVRTSDLALDEHVCTFTLSVVAQLDALVSKFVFRPSGTV
jgi:hypothetical protein